MTGSSDLFIYSLSGGGVNYTYGCSRFCVRSFSERYNCIMVRTLFFLSADCGVRMMRSIPSYSVTSRGHVCLQNNRFEILTYIFYRCGYGIGEVGCKWVQNKCSARDTIPSRCTGDSPPVCPLQDVLFARPWLPLLWRWDFVHERRILNARPRLQTLSKCRTVGPKRLLLAFECPHVKTLPGVACTRACYYFVLLFDCPSRHIH